MKFLQKKNQEKEKSTQSQDLFKTMSETKPSRSSRYEVAEDEDVDMEEINLRADESIEDAITASLTITPTFTQQDEDNKLSSKEPNSQT